MGSRRGFERDELTRFGSVWADPARTAAGLRAAAARHGVPLSQVDDTQLAACAVAADAWATVFDTDTISRAYHRGESATRSLAAILARAAGNPSATIEVDNYLPAGSDWLTRTERYASWVRQVGLDPCVVLTMAAEDLAAGEDLRLHKVVSAFLAVAETYEL